MSRDGRARQRLKTPGLKLSYRRQGHPSGSPTGTPAQKGEVGVPGGLEGPSPLGNPEAYPGMMEREVVAGDADAAMILGMDAAKAEAALRLEIRARQHLGEPIPEEVLNGEISLARACRLVFGPFFFSPRIIALTKQRIIEDPAFHARMFDKTVPTPQATRADEGGQKAVVLVVGGDLNLGYAPKQVQEGAIDVEAVQPSDPGNAAGSVGRFLQSQEGAREEQAPEIKVTDGAFRPDET